MMVSFEHLIQEALQQLQTKEQFKELFESAIMQDRSTIWLWDPKISELPADEVDNFYQILLGAGESRRQQLDAFEEAAFEIILDEAEYIRRSYCGAFEHSLYGEYLLNTVHSDSPNVKSGKWPEKIKEAIKLDDIVSGKIHHNPYEFDTPLNGQSQTYIHQNQLLRRLVNWDVTNSYVDFWENIRQNPSFIEIDFLLARRESHEAIENVLPKLFKFYHETLNPEIAASRSYFLVLLYTHLKDELVIEQFLADPRNEYETKVKALTNMKINRPELASVFNQGDAIFMTGYGREGDNTTVNYILIEESMLSRQQTTLDMETGKVLDGRLNHSSMLLDFAKQYETFVEQYRTQLSKF